MKYVQVRPNAWEIEHTPEEQESIRRQRLQLRLKLAKENMQLAIDRYLELKTEAREELLRRERAERIN